MLVNQFELFDTYFEEANKIPFPGGHNGTGYFDSLTRLETKELSATTDDKDRRLLLIPFLGKTVVIFERYSGNKPPVLVHNSPGRPIFIGNIGNNCIDLMRCILERSAPSAANAFAAVLKSRSSGNEYFLDESTVHLANKVWEHCGFESCPITLPPSIFLRTPLGPQGLAEELIRAG